MKQSLPRVSQPTTRDKTTKNEGPPASSTRSKTANIRPENAAAVSRKEKIQHAKIVETHRTNEK